MGQIIAEHDLAVVGKATDIISELYFSEAFVTAKIRRTIAGNPMEIYNLTPLTTDIDYTSFRLCQEIQEKVHQHKWSPTVKIHQVIKVLWEGGFRATSENVSYYQSKNLIRTYQHN